MWSVAMRSPSSSVSGARILKRAVPGKAGGIELAATASPPAKVSFIGF